MRRAVTLQGHIKASKADLRRSSGPGERPPLASTTSATTTHRITCRSSAWTARTPRCVRAADGWLTRRVRGTDEVPVVPHRNERAA